MPALCLQAGFAVFSNPSRSKSSNCARVGFSTRRRSRKPPSKQRTAPLVTSSPAFVVTRPSNVPLLCCDPPCARTFPTARGCPHAGQKKAVSGSNEIARQFWGFVGAILHGLAGVLNAHPEARAVAEMLLDYFGLEIRDDEYFVESRSLAGPPGCAPCLPAPHWRASALGSSSVSSRIRVVPSSG